jgi:predicted dehydrogenase
MYAMERGVSVVCEKPLAKTTEEAWKYAEYAAGHNIVTGINFNFRYYPMLMQMKQMVASGETGELFTVHGSYLQDWLQKDTDYNWRLEPGISGESRAFGDIGSHWIDILVETVTGQRAAEVLADFATFHKTRKKPLKAVDTYSDMGLRPEDYQMYPSILRIMPLCCSALMAGRGKLHGFPSARREEEPNYHIRKRQQLHPSLGQ